MPSIGRWVALKAGSVVITLLVMSLLVFAGIHMIPGSFAQVITGPDAPQALVDRVVKQYALDQPLPVQYVAWLGGVLQGNFGYSMQAEEPVAAALVRRAPVTVELAILASTFALCVGLPLGIAASVARSRSIRMAARGLGRIGLSLPEFVVGSILVLVVSAMSLGLRVGDYVGLLEDPGRNLRSLILPAFTLALFPTALMIRTTGEAVDRVRADKYVLAALARGETRWQIVHRHLLRNIAIPVVTIASTTFGYLLGGAVIVELIFAVPGVGQLAATAVQTRDYAVVQSVVILAAAAFIAVNFVADLSYVLIDRRTSGQRGAATS